MSETTTDARQTLLRELCEQINLWDQDAVIEDEDGLAEHWLLPVVDRYTADLTEQLHRARALVDECWPEADNKLLHPALRSSSIRARFLRVLDGTR